MQNPYSNIIQYFKSCYQADARDVQLMNFFSKKVENSFLLKDSDLITGKSLLYPVSTKWGKATKQALSIYDKEKDLYAFSLFLVGRYNIAGKSQRVVAPLILHPLELQEIDEVYYLSVREGYHIFNPFFFQLANSAGGSTEAKEELYEKAHNDFIQFDDCVFIDDIVKKHFSNIDTTDLLKYPDLYQEKDIKSLLKIQKGNSYVLVPASGVGLMKKTLGNIGIYTELNEISESKSASAPIRALFGEKETNPSIPKTKDNTIYAPVLLSHFQAEICRNTNQDISVVIGPPGTGKSFTIAAMAADAVAKGKSVLITSKNNQAVNVIADKIEQEMKLPQISVRAGRKDYLKILKKRIEGLKYLYHFKDGLDILEYKHRDKGKKITKLNKEIAFLEDIITKRERNEINKGLFLNDKNLWLHKWRMRWLEYKSQGIKPMNYLFEEYYDLLTKRDKLVNDYLKDHISLAKTKITYANIKKFYDAIRARTGTKRDILFSEINWTEIHRILPVWLVNFQDIHKVVPHIYELFDLVIIDEATQCDIASALPVLQRGKKAIIVGDPKQLRHISFLSRSEQNTFKEKMNLKDKPDYLLDYRDSSILDIALERISSGSQIQVLNEHYRSQSDIIRFSNEEFYDNNLQVMNATPLKEKNHNIFLHITDGKRDAKGYNKTEANAILKEVLSIVSKDENVNPELCRTIGMLSPFRGQVEYLQEAISEALSTHQIERHKILIGTPHAFQGEERDVMFISFTIDAETSQNVIRYAEKPDVMNVSITRAKNKQHVYISCSAKGLKSKGLLSKYVTNITWQERKISTSFKDSNQDEFMQEVVSELKGMKIDKLLLHHQVAGLDLDIVLVHQQKTKTIDLVGFPGTYEGAYHLEHYRLLSRIGVEVFPISYSEWTFNRAEAIQRLREFVHKS